MNILNFIVSFHKKKKSFTYKIISLTVGATFFLIILPAIFIALCGIFEEHFLAFKTPLLDFIIPLASIPFGLYFLIWATYLQWKVGKGTPAPNASTDKLVVTGPYKLCRNPIELGAIFYYLGVGTLIDSLAVGIVCMILGFLIGTFYHKFVEEKELKLRFGKEYDEYKSKTPFLFPKFWS